MVNGALQVPGLQINNLTDGTGLVRKQGVIVPTRAIYDSDTTTVRYYERVTAGDVVMQGAPYAQPIETRDTDFSTFAPRRHVSVGTGTIDITTGTTPSVKGQDAARLNYSGATSITNFTNAIDGQWLHLFSTNGNPTLVNNDTAGGIVMKSGANFTFTTHATKQLRFLIDRWYEF